jgi:hypothetical protein
MKDIIYIANESPRTHLLVYVYKNADAIGGTFKKFSPLVPIPIEIIDLSITNLDDYLRTLVEVKAVYEAVIE